MNNYTVEYRKMGAGTWKMISNVMSDGYLDGHEVRFFMLEDNTLYEIAAHDTEFKFSPERQALIEANQKAAEPTSKE